MRHYKITSTESGYRLDHYLTHVKPDLTRHFIQNLIKGGAVFVNHKKILKTGHSLKEGDELIVIIPSLKEVGIVPENIPLTVLYEDKNLIVLNKPAGMVVHPTDHGAHVSGTLVNALMHHCKDLSGMNGEKRPGIVHRLDKDTSGIIIVAKNDDIHGNLAKQFEDRQVTKRYITLLKGHLTPEEGSVEAPLLKTHGEKNVRISAQKNAKYALTHYRVLRYVGVYSLVEVRIITGRTHQIRVHFASIGYSVCGDTQYGDSKTNENLKPLGLTRQFLHAAYLKITHPVTGKVLEITASLPEDLENVLKKLG
ncbi:RNA pseudouridine synthase [Candidatus Peregrinibacteria bacterium CG_4_10_14_0_2_um_filter_43_11]|nr:MAG: RNA pseudouridine synthase [Candidatus Peregrinibacteria bacterium CG_4_10_14_0_2_um_filter_43_11]